MAFNWFERAVMRTLMWMMVVNTFVSHFEGSDLGAIAAAVIVLAMVHGLRERA